MRLDSKAYIAIGSLIFLLIVVFVSVYLAGQTQDIRNRASDGSSTTEKIPANVDNLIDQDGDGKEIEEFEEDTIPPILKSLDQEYGISEIEQVFE